MSLFVEEEASGRIWKKSWRLIWPKDDYLEKLLDNGLTPVLGGYSLLQQEIDKADEAKAEEPKADEIQVEKPKAEEPKVDDPKVDDPKVDEPKAEEPKVDEPKVDDPKVDDPKVDEPKVDEPKVDDPKVDDPKVDEPKVDEPKVDDPKAEEPKVDEPKVDDPKAEEPKVDEPKVDEPKVDDPKVDEPKVDEPKADEPKADEPKADETKVDEIKADETKADETKADVPKTNELKLEESEGFNFVFGVVKNKPDLPEKLEDILGENYIREFKESLHSDAIFDHAKMKVTIPSTNTCLYVGLHDGQFWPKEVEDIGCLAKSVQGAQTTAVIFYSDPSRTLHNCVEGQDNMLVFTGGFAAVLPDGVGVEKVAWCVSEPQKG